MSWSRGRLSSRSGEARTSCLTTEETDSRETEVGELEVTFGVDEEVVGFEITVREGEGAENEESEDAFFSTSIFERKRSRGGTHR